MKTSSNDPEAVVPSSFGHDGSLSEIALDLHEAGDTTETIDRILEYSCSSTGSDGAGALLIHARRRIEVVASTDDAVAQAHLLQLELDEGPCLDASEDPSTIYRVDDATTDLQWPRWNAEVVKLGFRTVLALPLATSTRRYGSLNLYAHRPHAFDGEDVDVALILARHASVALATSHHIDGLRKAVDTRKLVGIAIGILMARYEIDEDTGFSVLSRYSQANNIKLRDVAQRVVDERGLPPL